jgi:5-methylcytosine-specific restriction endonuclease McrA
MTRKGIVKKLDTLFSLYIRKRYADENGMTKCFTCGKVDHTSKLHAGHFQSRKHYATRWNEINVQVQCPKCNLFGQGEQYTFGVKLDEEYGKGTADMLINEARNTVKLSNDDLKELIEKYENYA